MNTINERFLMIMESQKKNYSTFGRDLGFSPQTIKSICEGRNKPSCDIIQSIIEKFPQFDPLWFTIGIGEMHKDLNTSKESNQMVEILKRENEILLKNNDFLLKNQERLWNMVETIGKKIKANEYPQVETKGNYYDLRPLLQTNEVQKEELGIVA